VYPVPKEVNGSKDKQMEVKVKKDVKLNAGEFTPNGEAKIKFNQKLNIPFNFVEN